LIQDVVPEYSWGFSLIYGDYDVGKTYAALDMALSVSSGLGNWHGLPAKQAAVLYIAAEAPAALSERVPAWHAVHGDFPQAKDFKVYDHALQFADADAVKRFITEMDGAWAHGPEFTIVDTYSKCNIEGSENESAQANRWSSGLSRLCTPAVVLHHSGRAGHNPRGSNALECDASVVIRVDRAGDIITLTWERVRIGPCPSQPLKLRMKPITYACDGTVYENVILERVDHADTNVGDVSSMSRVAPSAFVALASFSDGATLTDWSRKSGVPLSTLGRWAEKWASAGNVLRRADKKFVLTALGAHLLPAATTITHPL
jgi:hypothetical protein